MKGISARSRTIVWVICAVLLFVGMHKLYSYVFSVETIVFSVDPVIAQDTQKDIEHFVYETQKMISDLPQLAEKITEHFSYIKHVTLQRVPPRTLYVELIAQHPLCIINKDKILLGNNAVIEKDALSNYFVEDIAALTCNAHEVPVTLKDVVTSIPYSAFCDYNVTWNNENEIVLQDKDEEHFSLLCNSDQLPTKKMLAHCAYIKQDLDERGAFTQKKAKQWVADLRFNKQIILYKNPGG